MARLLALACLAVLPLQAAVGTAGQDDDLAARRRRWEQLDPAEQRVLEERFAEFRALGREEQRAFERRAGRIESVEDELREALPPELERELAGLDRRRRDAVWHEQLEAEMRRRGRRHRDRLPADLEAEVEAAPPWERPLVVDRFHRERLERIERTGGRGLERLGASLGRSPAEVEAVRGLPHPERRDTILAWKRERLLGQLERSGPPPELDPKELDAMRSGPLPRFFETWRDLEERRVDDPDLSERARLFHRVMQLAHPTMEDRMEFAGLSHRERRERIGEQVRARTLSVLERSGEVDEAELESLRALHGHDYVEALHELIGPGGARRPRPHDRFERRPGRGPGPGGPPGVGPDPEGRGRRGSRRF